jgi:uncharacterized protein with NRDE domain
MCLIFLSFNNHPTYKLIVAGNRDEFYNRRTAPAAFWEDHPDVLGGRDLEGGGTWLGMNRAGKISMLTNYRDPKHIDPLAPSRGHLVSDYLFGNTTAEQYIKAVEQRGARYNGFNLILGSPDELWYYSNYKQGVDKLAPGFYGLSNHLLDTPWPKVVRGKEKLQPMLARPRLNPDEIFDMLYDVEPAPDHMLPDTGLSLDRERALSSMFIKTDGYGSRCSTVVLVEHSGEITFAERVYDLSTFIYTTQTFRLKI